MAVKTIKSLTLTTTLNDTDDIVVEDTKETKRIQWSGIKTLLKSLFDSAGAASTVQSNLDAYETSNDAALAAVKTTANSAVQSVKTGTSNGTIAVDGTNVSVYGLGSAAYKTAGSASGNVPTNGAALGTTANVPVVTNASGALIPHASGALGTAAFKAAGSASGNVPINGSALGTTANVPVVTNTSGQLIPHASGALGTAAFKASTAFDAAGAASTVQSNITDGTIVAKNAEVADTLGTATVGSTTKPIYLKSGVATALTGTVGSSTKPIYISSGTLTAASSTVGAAAKPVYMSSGTITACSSTVGGTATPVYMNSGTITKCSSTVGASMTPVYMNAGVVTACGISFVVDTDAPSAPDANTVYFIVEG